MSGSRLLPGKAAVNNLPSDVRESRSSSTNGLYNAFTSAPPGPYLLHPAREPAKFHDIVDVFCPVGRFHPELPGIAPRCGQPSAHGDEHRQVIGLSMDTMGIDILPANIQIAIHLRIGKSDVEVGQLFKVDLIAKTEAIIRQIAHDPEIFLAGRLKANSNKRKWLIRLYLVD